MSDKILGMIALANKGGKVISGKFQISKAMEMGELCLIIFAKEAAKNTTNDLSYKAKEYKIDVITYGSSKEFEQLLGKKDKKVLGIIDENFSKAIKNLYDAK